MFDKNIQLLIDEVSELARKHCGPKFVENMEQLTSERERLLNNIWSKQLGHQNTNQVLREIDFDTIVLNAARFMDIGDYAKFLFDVAEKAMFFGQLDKAHNLLTLLINRHACAGGLDLIAKTHHYLGRVAFYRSEFLLATYPFNSNIFFRV